MASQFGNLPPGAAPYGPRPDSPRGLYREFGMPESLLRIHFPARDPNKNPSTSNPWYWYYELQQPYAFSFLAPPTWGPGWVRIPFFGVIKILAIDTQKLVPIPKVGQTSLENAVKRGIPDVAWGRIDFREQSFWDLVLAGDAGQNAGMPKTKPKFDTINGQIKARDNKTNINKQIEAGANQFATDWNGNAAGYNTQAAGVDPTAGFHPTGFKNLFRLALPTGPPTTFSQFANQLGDGKHFQGPIPTTAFFNFNTFTTDAYAFSLKVGQLDPNKWNMSEFPPLDSTKIGNGLASAKSKNYSGFGRTAFPLHGP